MIVEEFVHRGINWTLPDLKRSYVSARGIEDAAVNRVGAVN